MSLPKHDEIRLPALKLLKAKGKNELPRGRAIGVVHYQ